MKNKIIIFIVSIICLLTYLNAKSQRELGLPPKEILTLLHDQTPLAPTQVFDNLYCIGTKSVVAWALKTSEGIVLIDSMWDDDDARLIEQGLKLYGLDAKEIKLIIITHGHGDHYGGANYLAKKYGAQVLMSQKDAEYMLSYNKGPNIPKYPKPKVDRFVKDGEKITLGDIQILSVETPGHTVGGISLIFPVKFQGKIHYAMLWGGTGIPKDRTLQEAYRKSLDKFERYAKEKRVDIELSAHLFRNDGYAKLKSVYTKNYEKHPFIVGEEKVLDFFATYRHILDEKLKQ